MAALDSTTPDAPVDVPHGGLPGTGSPALRGAAMVLWVVVGGTLGYGVLQTALKAAALFG